MKTFIFAILFHITFVAAKRYTYTTSTVTSCFTSTPTNFVPAAATPTQGSDGAYTVNMPECKNCEPCTDCAYTRTYTTSYGVFAPTGVATQAYTIKEVYSGMTTAPDAKATGGVPQGFTTGVQVCTACGDEPVTQTMTYPQGGKPYASGMTNVPTDVAGPTTFARVPAPSGTSGTGSQGDQPKSSDDPMVVTGAASTRSFGGAWLALIVPLVLML